MNYELLAHVLAGYDSRKMVRTERCMVFWLAHENDPLTPLGAKYKCI